MFVDPKKNYALAMALWNGQPSERLMWTTYFSDSVLNTWAQEAGYAGGVEFLEKELGAMEYGAIVHPVDVHEPEVEVVKRREGDSELREYRSPWGVLTETSRGGRLMKHRVSSAQDLRVLIKMWENRKVAAAPERLNRALDLGRGRWPVVAGVGTSALQHMIQVELSIEDFWYAMSDHAALMEEAMEAWQACLAKAYALTSPMPVDGWILGENTSTALISPAYYAKYSLGHVRSYCDAARRAGKRAVVHMCGHLHSLMPLFPQTGMHGIDTLTPPPVGDTPFRYAYEAMPPDFFCTGRFGTSLWYGKSRAGILANLASALPHDIYRERAFVLGVTGDGMNRIPLDNIRLLRDCINEYEQTGE